MGFITMIVMFVVVIVLFINIRLKDVKISKLNIFLSIVIPVVVLLINFIILIIATNTVSFDVENGVYNGTVVAFVSIMVEIGVIVYFFVKGREDEFSKIWILGIILSIVLHCLSYNLIGYAAPMLTIVSENGFSLVELLSEVGDAILFGVAISALSINLFTLVTFKKSENTLFNDFTSYE